MFGYLDLGTAVSGIAVVTPVDASYAPQLVSLTTQPGGVSTSDNACVFGPVSGSWGTLTAFGLSDLNHNPICTGALTAPIAPALGQIIAVPPGSISVVSRPPANLLPVGIYGSTTYGACIYGLSATVAVGIYGSTAYGGSVYA